MTVLDFLARLFGWPRRRRRRSVHYTIAARAVPLAALPPGLTFRTFARARQTRTIGANTLTTTLTPVTNPAVSATDDQAINIVLTGRDAAGVPVTVPVTAPGIAVQDGSGTDISADLLVATDSANPLSLWFKRAPYAGGAEPVTLTGTITVTPGSDAAPEVTPFTFAPGTLSAVTEQASVVPLAAVPSTVTFPPATPSGATETGGMGLAAPGGDGSGVSAT